MATPRPFDHFSSVVKQLEVRQKAAAEQAAKIAAQAEAANKLVMVEAAEVIRKERELAQQKADLEAYAQDLRPYKCPES